MCQSLHNACMLLFLPRDPTIVDIQFGHFRVGSRWKPQPFRPGCGTTACQLSSRLKVRCTLVFQWFSFDMSRWTAHDDVVLSDRLSYSVREHIEFQRSFFRHLRRYGAVIQSNLRINLYRVQNLLFLTLVLLLSWVFFKDLCQLCVNYFHPLLLLNILLLVVQHFHHSVHLIIHGYLNCRILLLEKLLHPFCWVILPDIIYPPEKYLS